MTPFGPKRAFETIEISISVSTTYSPPMTYHRSRAETMMTKSMARMYTSPVFEGLNKLFNVVIFSASVFILFTDRVKHGIRI